MHVSNASTASKWLIYWLSFYQHGITNIFKKRNFYVPSLWSPASESPGFKADCPSLVVAVSTGVLAPQGGVFLNLQTFPLQGETEPADNVGNNL